MDLHIPSFRTADHQTSMHCPLLPTVCFLAGANRAMAWSIRTQTRYLKLKVATPTGVSDQSTTTDSLRAMRVRPPKPSTPQRRPHYAAAKDGLPAGAPSDY